MLVISDAVRPWAAHSRLLAGSLFIVLMAGSSAARADDNAAWFGQVYRGTNLGQSAGIMRLGKVGLSEGQGDRRGTRVASLGRDYVPAAESDEEERVVQSKPARRTRVASLGDDGVPTRAASSKRSRKSAKSATSRKVRLASLGGTIPAQPSPGPSLSGGAVRWTASSGCLNSGLRSVISSVAASFGPVTVNSTCRSRRHNARVGGARHSHHLTGNAVDFRVRGNWRGVRSYLRSSGLVGGLKHYGGGLFHIDTGPRRTW